MDNGKSSRTTEIRCLCGSKLGGDVKVSGRAEITTKCRNCKQVVTVELTPGSVTVAIAVPWRG